MLLLTDGHTLQSVDLGFGVLKGGGILWPWAWLGPGTTGEMPLDPLWERLCGFLERGESVVLATIAPSQTISNDGLIKSFVA